MKLTPEQIKNWRKVLCGMIGPYALIMSEEQVTKLRDKFQNMANSADKKEQSQTQED